MPPKTIETARAPGRPPKQKAAARLSTVAFRVDDFERTEIETAAKAAGQTVSEYARNCAMHGRFGYKTRKPKQEREKIERQAIAALNRVGANLWSLLRRLDKDGSPPGDLSEVIDEVRAAVAKIAEDRE